jgi:signal peptidase I
MTSVETPKSLARDYFETIVSCVIFVLFARAFVFQQSKIPTGSMRPTLLIGDYIMVNKFAYAPVAEAIPLLGRLERALFPIREVQRGIKRVIALPDDEIEIRDRQVYINGEPIEEPYKVHRSPRQFTLQRANYARKRVPEGMLFCMGDNRDNSSDSREWGFVPRDYLKGRAFMIWWSYEEETGAYLKTSITDWIRSIGSKLSHLFTRSRWRRTFQIIE